MDIKFPLHDDKLPAEFTRPIVAWEKKIPSKNCPKTKWFIDAQFSTYFSSAKGWNICHIEYLDREKKQWPFYIFCDTLPPKSQIIGVWTGNRTAHLGWGEIGLISHKLDPSRNYNLNTFALSPQSKTM